MDIYNQISKPFLLCPDPRSQINEQPLFTMTDMEIKFIDSKLGGLAYIETDDTYKDYKFCFKIKSNNML